MFKDEISNIDLSLADGTTIFVESEDGELEGKNAFTVDEEGNPTEEAVANGVHELQDGRSITVEDGVVMSVQESEEEDLNNKIAELEAKMAEMAQEKEAAEAKVTESQQEIKALAEEFKNLSKLTVGDQSPPKKPIIKAKNRFEEEPDKGHPLDSFAKYLNNK